MGPKDCVFYDVLGEVGRIVVCSECILVFLEPCGIEHKTVSAPHAESITTVTINRRDTESTVIPGYNT